MGLFSRLINMMQGLFGGFVTSIEEKNPVAVFEVTIQQQKQQYQKLKKASASIVYLRDKTQSELYDKEKECEQVTAELRYAVEHGMDDAAMQLISLQDNLSERISSLKFELTSIEKQAEQAIISLQEFQQSIRNLIREKDKAISEIASIEAQESIKNQLSDLAVAPDLAALNNVRTSIQKRKAGLQIESELSGTDTEKQLKEIRSSIGSVKNHARLSELKRQMGVADGDEVSKRLAVLRKQKNKQIL
jgi:phage shock protein A